MILHLLDHLPQEVDEILLTVSYMPEMLRDYFENHPIGRSVEIVVEKEPLGTGGAIKNVEKKIDGAFIVLNADIISSIDYSEMIDFHNKTSSLGTISLFEVEDVTAYGMVTIEDAQRITAFTEKPEPGSTTSNFINAGTYLLEPEALDFIPSGRKVSIERVVFPELVQTYQGMRGFQFSGYWTDAGTPEKFLLAQSYILGSLPGRCHVPESASVRGQLGENVALGEEVVIERGARLSNCTLLEGAVVQEGAVVEDSIIGEASVILKNSLIRDSVIGDGMTLEGECLGERIGDRHASP
jgi:mannose-1-phosphate guanylyltransferase